MSRHCYSFLRDGRTSVRMYTTQLMHRCVQYCISAVRGTKFKVNLNIHSDEIITLQLRLSFVSM